MFCMLKKKNVSWLCFQTYSNQVILSMIPNIEGWHYVAVKKLSALLRGITSKHFEMKDLGQYHDLYVQSDAVLLLDVFENFINMYFEI